MQKFSPSANSQRSATLQMKRFGSIGHSNGEVLLNEYFNLPMISTKSQIGNQGTPVIKLNTISKIENLNELNQSPTQYNNNIPLQDLISQGEKSLKLPNYNFLEKYYQNKVLNITKQRKIEPTKSTRLQQENIRERRYSTLEKKCVQNFSKSNNGSLYSLDKNLKIEQDQFKTISNEYRTQQFIPDMNLVSHNNQKSNEIQKLTQRIDFIRRKLKIYVIFVFSAMVISKKFRFLKKDDTQIIFKLNNKLSSCQRIINQNGLKYIEEQQQQFVQVIANKVIYYLNSQKYIDECNQSDELSNPILSMDFKKLRVQCFSKLIYQNLELITRKNNFPEFIKCLLITSLYKTSKQQTSFFVGERCHFYQTNRIHIQREQKLAIAMEYLLFQIIIPNLLQLVNKQQLKLRNHHISVHSNNNKCKIQTQKIFIIIASLLHQQFINRFQNMRKVKNPNGYMVNKRLNIEYLENNLFNIEIKVAYNIGDNNQVLEGLIEQEQLQQFEKSKPIWKSQLDRLFDKILQNTESLIDF
ncbi:unnamed protein product [Paramecium primaurelia]|uniref:Uncharacterized protein n=1 Tax=Paramecium primaurelia TaxID=5886 RepID=A0A8S1M054_PARPR|nr:unnamed protein product [Paramecium primaurelia]